MFERPHGKAQRIRELLESIPGVTLASEMDNDENPVQIHEDGTTLTGTEWITPQDFVDQDIKDRRLVALKGATPTEWPTLEPTG